MGTTLSLIFRRFTTKFSNLIPKKKNSLSAGGAHGRDTRLSRAMPGRARKRVWCFLVTWGGVAPRYESSNQIAERVFICDDVAIEHEI